MTERGPSLWDDKTITLFRMLCEEKALSYSDIAKAMSEELGVRISKNACIGKARRLRLPMRKTPQRERKRAKPAAPASMVEATPRLAVWSVAEPPVRRANGYLTLLELERTSCRYPFGNRPPYLFCGKPIRDTTSYCPHHCDVVYGHTRQGFRR